MSRVRAAVVGVGRLGAEHARILAALPDVELAGVHDTDEDRGRAVAERCGTVHAADRATLLEASDAVVVAVPTADHHEVAGAGLEAGCHVLVEKPLTAALAEADDLIARAEARSLVLAVGHVERFNGAVRAGRPHLDEPRYVESLRLAPFQPRGTDVTVVLDLMIHDLDLVLGVVPGRVASVNAVGVPVLTGNVDIANARLVFEGGAVANITASRVSMERKRELRLFQPAGYLSLDLASGTGEYLRRRADAVADGWPGLAAAAAVPGGGRRSLEEVVDRLPLVGDGREPLELELRAFLDAVRGEEAELVTGREAREALELALRITREIEEFTDVVAQGS